MSFEDTKKIGIHDYVALAAKVVRLPERSNGPFMVVRIEGANKKIEIRRDGTPDTLKVGDEVVVEGTVTGIDDTGDSAWVSVDGEELLVPVNRLKSDS